MKKILLTAIILLVGIQIQAQYKPVVFGMRAAMNIGWMKPDTEGYASDGIVPGFTWGFIGDFYLMENYAISTGFNVNFNGGKLEYPYAMDIGNDTIPETGVLSRKYNLKYLQIPLTLKMKAEIKENIRLYGKIGLGTAFNLSAKANDAFTWDGGTESAEKINISDEITLMRQSLIVGGGVEIVLKGSTAVVIDLTYDNGFNNILLGNNPADPMLKNRAFHNFLELGAGILF